uniref:Cystinosin n=1 Tax=Acrobeloides nanus TaxID=290746 RepID=A0A914CVJ1_9BILA
MEAKQMPHHPVHDDGHLMSYTCMAFCSLIGIFVIITASLSMMGVFTWLRFIDNLALIKMIITACKYYPQAVHNYKRKSTLGWSIARVWLDFIGGSMSIAQMILQAVNTDDWSGFIGNKGKLGIGLLSVGFDIVFVVQHYLLYYHQKPIDEEEEETVEKGKKY